MSDRRLPLEATLRNLAPQSPLARARRLFSKPLLAFALSMLALSGSTLAQQRYFDPASKAAFLQAVPERERMYVFDVGARLVYPQPGQPIAFTNGRAEVYLQFHQPVTAAERGQLTLVGVRFFQALSGTTYLARVTPAALQELQKLPKLRAIEAVQFVDKLDEGLYTGNVRSNVSSLNGMWSVYVRFYADVKLEHALKLLDSVRAFVSARDRYDLNERMLVVTNQARILELANSPFVREICQIPAPPKAFNVVSAGLINVDDIQALPYGLNGGGVVIGEWDEGPVRDDHPDLVNRVFIGQDNGIGDGDHSTHVCGTMIGDGTNNANARGMAPAGTVVSFDFDGNPAAEHDLAADFLAMSGFPMTVTNNSWGAVLGWDQGVQTGNLNLFGRYDGEAADFDTVVRDRNLIICKSSGNDSNDCNPNDATDCDGVLAGDGLFYENQPTWSVAKNVITVGATNDDGTYASFSSAGPAADNRMKPDVCANGVGLFSTWALGNTLPGNCDGADYCSISGTSMASPSVAGACALLVQRYIQVIGLAPTPDIIKALLVNTAVDQGRPGPDYLFGHGLVDALAATQTIDGAPVRILTNAVDQDDTDEFLIAVPGGATELRVTLNWLDPEGVADSADPDQINNLDLTLISPSNVTFFPFSASGDSNYIADATATGANNLDTVEHARVLNPQQGFWKVRVGGTSVPSGPQNYALVANRAFQLPDQPNITVNAALEFDQLCTGEFQDKVVSVFNTGGGTLSVHSINVIPFAGGNFTIHPDPIQPFLLQAGAHVDFTVHFDPVGTGLQLAVLDIKSDDPDQPDYTVVMQGTGCPPPDISLSGSLDFGVVCAGDFAEQTINICNLGVDDLLVTEFHFDNSPDFTVINNPFPATVLAGECVPVTLRFTPTVPGLQNGSLVVGSNDPDEPLTGFSALGERCPPPDIAVSGSLDFGTVCAGELAEKTIEVCNIGGDDLIVVSLDFFQCNDFKVVNNIFPATVIAGHCLPVTIRYTPTGAGTHTCLLAILSNDPDEPLVVLTATGTTPVNTLDVPVPLCFPPTVIQSVSASCKSEQPYSITNTGACPVLIKSVTITPPGPHASDFTIVGLPTLPVTLAPGEVLGGGLLKLVFKPTNVERYVTGTLNVTWQVDSPNIGDMATVSWPLAGEGVKTGARLLVNHNGAFVPVLDRVTLYKVNSMTPLDLAFVDQENNVLAKFEAGTLTCPFFLWHREWGGVSNPIKLLPGDYLIEVALHIGGTPYLLKKDFTVDICDFLPDLVINF